MRIFNIQVPPVGMRVPITPKDLVAPDSVPRKKPQEESKGELTMNIQDEIKELKKRIVELEKQDKEEQGFPQDGDKYWYIDDRHGALPSTYSSHYTDKYRQAICNVFKTKEQAEFQIEKLKVESELRKFSRPFKYGDWNFEILWNNHENNIELDWSGYIVRQSVIYFESGEMAEKAIESVGEERIKKYIFELED
jgi:hypothetical protein